MKTKLSDIGPVSPPGWLTPLARAIAPSVVILSLSACGGGGGGGNTDTPREGDNNTAPVASISDIASPQSVGASIDLNGTQSSDADGDTLSYQWAIIDAPSGSSASVSKHTTNVALFETDLPGDYRIELVVSDGAEQSRATTTFTLTNSKPIANAGADQAVDIDSSATLNGSASSDIDGQNLSFEWQIVTAPAGSSAYLSSSTEVMPILQGIDVPGDYRIRLTVNDGLVNSDADDIVVSTNNIAPHANAGDNIGGKLIGDTVTLDGTQSTDADGDSLSYLWSFTSNIPTGTNAHLSDPSASMPSFTIDQKGEYEVALVVNDGTLNSNVDTVLINVGNTAPKAEAGAPQIVAVDTHVMLSASNSTDADGDDLTFTWSITSKPASSNAALAATNTLTTSFTADTEGVYIVQVKASDGNKEDTDTVIITAELVAINHAPIANAGTDLSFRDPPVLVQLDGSDSSDPDGDSLFYFWSLSKPAGSNAVIVDADSVMPTFTADIAGTYTVQLKVNDGDLDSDALSTMNVNVAENTRPIANAGPDQNNIVLGQPIALNATGSSDADGDTITYLWAVTNSPATANASLDNIHADTPLLNVDSAGDYLIQLTVSDGKLEHTDTTLISVTDGDPDGDGLLSSFEIAHSLNPNQADSDGDGIADGAEDGDSDGLNNLWEAALDYNINNNDSDGDGILDADEDFDADGYSNIIEIDANTDPTDPQSHPVSFADMFSFEVKSTPVTAGGNIQYAVTVGNQSQVDTLANVVLKLNLPNGVSFNRIFNTSLDSSTHSGCAASGLCNGGDAVFWNLGDVTPGDSITFEINASVANDVVPGTVLATLLEITSDSLSQAVELERNSKVIAQQDVSFTITPSKDPLAAGESFYYDLSIGNSSDEALENVELVLTLPNGVSVDQILDSGVANGNSITWTTPVLLPTQSLQRKVLVSLSTAAKEASILTAVAQLHHTDGESQKLHNSITVSEPMKLEVDYHLEQAVVAAGDNLTYNITVSNTSLGSTVKDAVIMLQVPAGISFHRTNNASIDSTTHSNCAASGLCAQDDEVFWKLGDLAAGDSISIEINAVVDTDVEPGSIIETPIYINADDLGDTIQLQRSARIVAEQEVFFTLSPSTDPVTAGSAFEYQLDLGNTSDEVLEDGVITLLVPEGISINNISHGGSLNSSFDGDSVRWDLAGLLPTQALQRSVSVTLADNAKLAQSLTAVAQLRHQDGLELAQELRSTVTVSEPLKLEVDYHLGQSRVAAGGNLKYSLTLSNTSLGSTVKDTKVMLRVPEGVSFNRFNNTSIDSTTHSGCAASGLCNAGDEVFWKLSDLAAGDSISFDINAFLDTDVEPGTIIKTPIFVSAEGLGDNLQLQRSATVIAEQEVLFTLSPSKDPAAPGESFTYTLDLGNSSDDVLENIDISLDLPSDINIETASDAGVVNGNQVVWLGSNLLPTASLKRSVTVTLSSGAKEAKTLTAIARLQHKDGLELDQELQRSVTVSKPLKLEVDYNLAQTVVQAGEALQYSITISNTSLGASVDNAVIMLQVPEGVSFNRLYSTSVDSSTHSGCSASGVCNAADEVFWNLGTLAAGDSITLDINATVSSDMKPGSVIETPIYVSADGLGDTLLLQRSAKVAANQNVFFTLSAANDPIAPGETFDYQLQLGNSGDAVLEEGVVQLILPQDLSVNSASDDANISGNTVTWNVPNLLPTGSLQRSVSVTLATDTKEAKTITAQATLHHKGGLELDQELHRSVSVSAPLKLAVDFDLTQAAVIPGGNIIYNITLENTSLGSQVSNAMVMLWVPVGVSFNRFSDSDPSSSTHSGCSASGQCSTNDEVIWKLDDLAAGDSINIQVNATIDSTMEPGTLIETPLYIFADGLGDHIQLRRSARIIAP